MFFINFEIACNSKCIGCISEKLCLECAGTDSTLRDPALSCICKSTAWNNAGTCTG